MEIPFVDLKAQYSSIRIEIDSAIKNTIENTSFIGGGSVRGFEQEFAAYIGASHCVGCGNGTDALYLALRALGVGPSDEVIVPANTFIASSEAVTMAGAKVVFADVDQESYTLTPETIEPALTKRTRAIMVVHLYGQPADMDRINNLAKTHDLFVVEDAAQAHGATCNGKRVGVLGDIGCFSFYPGKNLGAFGDAGAVVTNDADLAKRVRMFANHGRIDKYDHEIEGVNSRLDGIQAAILSAKLPHLEVWTEGRRRVAHFYTKALSNLDLVLPGSSDHVRHVYHLFVVRLRNRDEVRARLKDAGIATGIHYPVALHNLAAYSHLGHESQDFPNADQFSKEILSLPMYPEITEDQLGYVVDALKSAIRETRS